MAALETSTQSHGPLPLPCPAQVALALIVVRSKPTQLSLEEYLSQIRNVAVKMPVAEDEDRQLRFNSTALWKSAYEESEVVRQELLDKIFELKNQSSATVGRTDAASAHNLKANGKRKRDKLPTTREDRSSKRLLLSVDIVKNPGLDADFSLVDNEIFGSVSGGSSKLTRSFFDLRVALNARSGGSNALELAACRLCHSAFSFLVDVTPDAGQEHTPGLTKSGQPDRSRSHLSNACTAVQHMYPSLLQALDRANETGGMGTSRRNIVVEVVGLFDGLLEWLHTLLVQEAKDNAQPRKAKSSKLRKRRNTSQEARQNTLTDRREVCKLFTQLLLNMIASLKLERKPHASIFEGMMCLFLEHLGSTLSVAVFASGEGLKREETFPFGIRPPKGLVDVSSFKAETAVQVVQKEAPFLICLLRKFISVVDKTGGSLGGSSAHALFPSLGAVGIDDKESLTTRIKTKLQNTLLRGIFGDEQEERFRDALEKPPQSNFDKQWEEELDSSDVEDTKDPRWFIGKVWEHLGWDVL